MANKFLGGVRPGQADVSIAAFFRSTADNTELTGLVYTDITASYWRQGGTRTAITMATLAAVDSAHSNGGFIEVDSTNTPGLYRFDVPDEAFLSGADWVVVSLKAAGAFVYVERFSISSNPADLVAIDGNPVNDHSATLNLKRLSIQNDTDIAVTISSSDSQGVYITGASNNPAVELRGVDLGPGLKLGGGVTGAGVEIEGGLTSGPAMRLVTTDGHGIQIEPGGTGTLGIVALSNSLGIATVDETRKWLGRIASQAANVSLKGIKNWNCLDSLVVTYRGGITNEAYIDLTVCAWGVAEEWVDIDGGEPFDEYTERKYLGRLTSSGWSPDAGIGNMEWGDFLKITVGTTQGGTPGIISKGILTIAVATRTGAEVVSVNIPEIATNSEAFFLGADGGLYRVSGHYLGPVFSLPYLPDIIDRIGDPANEVSYSGVDNGQNLLTRLAGISHQITSATLIGGRALDRPTLNLSPAYGGMADADQYVTLVACHFGQWPEKYTYATTHLGTLQNGVFTLNEVAPSELTHRGENYRCIRTHRSSPVNEPGVGEQWEDFWLASGAGGAAWQSMNAYTGGWDATSEDIVPDALRIVLNAVSSTNDIPPIEWLVSSLGEAVYKFRTPLVPAGTQASTLVGTNYNRSRLDTGGAGGSYTIAGQYQNRVDLASIEDNRVDDNSATLKLKTLDLQSNDPAIAPLFISNTEENGFAARIEATQFGGIAASIVGEQIGLGISGTNNTGLALSSESGTAMRITGGGDALNITAGDTSGTGTGVRIAGGVTDGDGISIEALGNNGRGIDITSERHAMVLKSNTQIGLYITGYQEGVYVKSENMEGVEIHSVGDIGLRIRTTGTGDAVKIEGGTVAGNGISITTADGHGINIEAAGEGGKGGFRLNHTGADGVGMIIQGQAGGMQIGSYAGTGLSIGSNSTGNGVSITSSDGHGLSIQSAANNMNALYIQSTGDPGGGVLIEQAGSGDALKITTVNGHGINVLANGSSSSIHGINVDQQTGGSAVHLVSDNRHALQLSSGGSSRSPLHIFGLNPAYPAVHIEQFGATGEGLKITTVDGDGIFIDAGGTGLDINAPNSDLGITGGGGGGQIYEYIGTVKQYSGPQPVFRMVDANGAPITGLVAADFTVTVYKKGSVTGVVMLDLYKNIVEDANGYYNFGTNNDSIFFDVPGITKFVIEAAGAQAVYLACNVVNAGGADANVVTVEAPALAAIAAASEKNVTSITYNGDGTKNVITLADGTVITMGYTNGRLTSVTFS